MSNDTDYKICGMCGSLIPKENIFNIKGEEYCKTCIEKKLEQKNISSLGTFMCSLVPGVGQIFLGKKEKGAFLLSSFLLNIFLTGVCLFFASVFYLSTLLEIIFLIGCVFFPTLNLVIYVYSLFDANISRKYIENDVYVDGFIDKLAYKFFKKRNKNYLEEKVIDKRLQ